jgi:hypothetical protein
VGALWVVVTEAFGAVFLGFFALEENRKWSAASGPSALRLFTGFHRHDVLSGPRSLV